MNRRQGSEAAGLQGNAAGSWRRCVLALLGTAVLLAGCERTQTVQRGNAGLSMTQLYSASGLRKVANANAIPPPEEPADTDSPMVNEVFKNVKVLNDLSATEFSRLMQALSTWIAPDEGCDFCHNPDKLESDEKYPKIVARRMLLMTRQINTQWKQHVGATGVTCWTCHRGQAVPTGDWFESPVTDGSFVGYRAGQNRAGVAAIGNAALPSDPLSAFFTQGNEVRVQAQRALVSGGSHGASIKSAEWTYALMMYMSRSLGVNCTYCHNTRAMGRWGEESTPQRSTAWHGIRLVRELNSSYLIPLKPQLPVNRLSPAGDGPKVGCETCHKGAFKPLLGVTMLKDYPELAGPMHHSPPVAPLIPAAASAPAPASKVAMKN